MDGLEGILAIFGPMSGSDIERLVADMRSDHLLIAVFLLDFAQILLEAVAQGGAFRQPERKACAYRGRERKKFHLLTKNAVVALLCLLEES